MNSLKIVKLEFTLKATGEFTLPRFVGNTLRGAIGNALVHLYCDKHDPKCDCCDNRDECVYSNVFKSKYTTEYLPTVPNPFTIDIGKTKRIYISGDKLCFGVTLIGDAIYYCDNFIEAVKYAAEHNFGERNLPVELVSVRDEFSDALLKSADDFDTEYDHIYAEWTDNNAQNEADHIHIEFLTPFIYSNQNCENITFYEFMDRLFDRISAITDVYGDNEFVLPYNFAVHKNKIKTVCDLKPVIVKQKNKEYEASIGAIDFYGNLTRYIPYIILGQEIHFGKMTTRGFGQYKVDIM